MTAAAIPPQKSPSTWLLLALGAFGAFLGYMLAHGVMPFQRVPFERMEIGPDVAPPLMGLLLLMAVVLVYGCAARAPGSSRSSAASARVSPVGRAAPGRRGERGTDPRSRARNRAASGGLAIFDSIQNPKSKIGVSVLQYSQWRDQHIVQAQRQLQAYYPTSYTADELRGFVPHAQTAYGLAIHWMADFVRANPQWVAQAEAGG